MADQDLGLPIRTDHDGDAVVKLGDGTTPSQYAAVDASGAVAHNLTKVAGTALDTGNGTTSAGTPRVTLSSDSTGQVKLATGDNTAGRVKITDGTNTASVTASNAVKVDGSAVTQPVSAASLPLPTGASTSANQTNGNQTTQIVQGGNTATVTAGSALKVDGSAVTQPVSGTVTANQGGAPWTQNLTQVGGSAVALGQAAMASSIPVVISSNQTTIPVSIANPAGTVITDYQTDAAVAAGASTNHDYTVTTGKTLSFDKWLATASGKIKAEVQVDLGAGLVTKFVGFNSTANPNIYIDFSNLNIQVASTKKVRIIVTNKDNQAMDTYSTIMGTEV